MSLQAQTWTIAEPVTFTTKGELKNEENQKKGRKYREEKHGHGQNWR